MNIISVVIRLHCIDEAKIGIARLQKANGTTNLSTFAKQKTSNMIEAHFENIRNLIIDNIRASKTEIKIAVAWFTQRQLYDAVLDALERGVKVSLIMMKDFINCGIYGLPLKNFVDKGGLLHFGTSRGWTMHNKFCLFDNSIVISGSYNWTYSAETRNAENVIATDDDSVCSRFDDYFNRLWEESFAEETIPNVEISSEEVIQEFSFIHNELEAMVKNDMAPQDAIDILTKTKDNTATEVAKIAKPVMPPLNPIVPVYFDDRQLKPGECVILKTITLKLANGSLDLVKRGERLPFSKGNIIVVNEEGDTTEEFIVDLLSGSVWNSLTLLRFEDLPPMPDGRIKFKASLNISQHGLLSISAFCYYNGQTKKEEIQLVEGEDFIIGK